MYFKSIFYFLWICFPSVLLLIFLSTFFVFFFSFLYSLYFSFLRSLFSETKLIVYCFKKHLHKLPYLQMFEILTRYKNSSRKEELFFRFVLVVIYSLKLFFFLRDLLFLLFLASSGWESFVQDFVFCDNLISVCFFFFSQQFFFPILLSLLFFSKLWNLFRISL